MPKASDLPKVLTTAEAASRLNVSVRRVQQLVKSGRLPATIFGGSLMILEKDLTLVAERKTGRPRKSSPEDQGSTGHTAKPQRTSKAKGNS